MEAARSSGHCSSILGDPVRGLLRQDRPRATVLAAGGAGALRRAYHPFLTDFLPAYIQQISEGRGPEVPSWDDRHHLRGETNEASDDRRAPASGAQPVSYPEASSLSVSRARSERRGSLLGEGGN